MREGFNLKSLSRATSAVSIPKPRKISTSRIDEAFEDFLEGLNQKCFAAICQNEIQPDRISYFKLAK